MQIPRLSLNETAPMESEAPAILPEHDAKMIAKLLIQHHLKNTKSGVQPHSLEDMQALQELSKKHLKIPENKLRTMYPEDHLNELSSLLTPNQHFSYYLLPKEAGMYPDTGLDPVDPKQQFMNTLK